MIVTLKSHTMTALIDSIGAQLISLKSRSGTEYIWQRDPAHWKSCSPLLFPTVGNCRDGKYTLNGKTYTIPKHGFCRNADFAVSVLSEQEASFTLTDSPETRANYPFAFQLKLTYTLSEDGIQIHYAVTNPDTKPMYYQLGAHPGFNCPLQSVERFEDYVLEFEQEETAGYHSYDLNRMEFNMNSYTPILDHAAVIPLTHELFANDAIFFTDLRSKKVALKNPATGYGVEISYPDFATVAFWTAAATKAPFLCVEPWNGSAIRSDEDDNFLNRHFLQKLEGGESKGYRVEIKKISQQL